MKTDKQSHLENSTNHKNQKAGLLTIKSMALFVGLIGFTMLVFSCAQRADQLNNQDNVFQNCTTCQALVGGQQFFKSQSVDVNNVLTLDLDFIGSSYNYGNQGFNNSFNNPYGNNVYNNGFNNGYNASPIVSYAGPVGASGTLVISRQLGSFGCIIPAGSYALQTIQAGNWNQAIVTGLVLQVSSGPMSLIIQIPQAQVAAKTNATAGQTWNEVAPIGRLFGNIDIRAMTGVSCQVSATLR